MNTTEEQFKDSLDYLFTIVTMYKELDYNNRNAYYNRFVIQPMYTWQTCEDFLNTFNWKDTNAIYLMLDVCDRVREPEFLSDFESRVNNTQYIRYKLLRSMDHLISYFNQELKGENPNRN